MGSGWSRIVRRDSESISALDLNYCAASTKQY